MGGDFCLVMPVARCMTRVLPTLVDSGLGLTTTQLMFNSIYSIFNMGESLFS